MFRDLASSALSAAKKAGADAAEVSITAADGLSVEARNGDVETVEKSDERHLSINVYFGQRKGSAVSSVLTDVGIGQAIDAACEIARQTMEDPYAGLAPAELMATDFPDLHTDSPWNIDARAAIDMAVDCDKALRAHPDIIHSDGATVSTERTVGVYANTHGFIGEHAETQHGIAAIAVAGKGKQMQRDYWLSCHRHHDKLESPQAVGEKAAQRAARRLDARKIATRKMPVVLAPEIARAFIGHFAAAISGGRLHRNASFMLGKLEQKCFPSFIRIVEYPHLPSAMGSASFDAEGVATPAERVFVDDGIVRHYALGSYAARKLKLASTANAGGMHNLCLEVGGADADARMMSFDDLLADMGEGLVVTELIGAGINLVTGDYSRGAVGILVENGRLSHAVEEIAIAGNLATMFQSIRALGNDTDTRGNIRSGSILIDDITVAGD